MHILLINHYAGNPKLGMEFRPYYLAREWVKLGHKVLIVGATYSHLRKEQPNEGYENVDGIDYLWIKTNKYKGNGIGRIYSMFSFTFKLMFLSDKIYKRFKPNAVIASSTYPFDIYPANKIAKRCDAKLVFEVHDLWPLTPMELGGYSKRHPFIMLMQKAENYALKECDKCVSILPCVDEHVVKHGLDIDKLIKIPNGIVLKDWENPIDIPKEHTDTIIRLHKENKFIVGYTGTFSISNSLFTLLKIAKELVDSNISFVLVGDGTIKNELIEYIKDNQLNNVMILPTIPKLSIPTLLKNFDILYTGFQKQVLYRFGVSPNKLYDYMMAARPIIQAIDSGNNPVEDAKCGISVEPDNISAIASAILELKNKTKEELDAMGKNGQQYVLKHHTYDILAQQFIEII